MRKLSRLLIQSVSCMLLFQTSAGATPVVVYDSTTSTRLGSLVFNGASAGNMFTNMNADDLSVGPAYAGYAITQLTFLARIPPSATTSLTARPTFYLWAADGLDDGPGTFLAQYILPHTTLSPGVVTPLTVNDTTGSVLIPAGGKLWAGIGYDNDGGALTLSPADLDKFGAILVGTPTVGSSDAAVSLFSTPSSRPWNVNDPEVTPLTLALSLNFGWRILAEDTAAVPEPGSALLLGAGALAWALKRARS